MLTLTVSRLHWIKDITDDPLDLCAHGFVDFRIGDYAVPELASLDCTVSAAALYLMRSLTRSHSRNQEEKLFPCCGFTMYDISGQDDVVICGCPSGVDVSVVHDPTGITVTTADGTSHNVAEHEWREGVFGFADRVAEFYR